MTGFNFLGIGSCFNTKLFNTSAYTISKENGKNTLILFDCGETVFERLIELKLLENIQDIKVYITHLHSDHVGSLPSLIFYAHFVLNIKPTIYFPSDEITSLLELSGVNDDLYIHENAYEKENIFYAVKQKHAKELNCFGYLFNLDNNWIFYSGDSNELNIEVFNLLNKRTISSSERFPKDIIISEFYQDTTRYTNSAHLNVHNLAKLVPENYRNKITCMHFDDDETINIALSYGFKVATLN